MKKIRSHFTAFILIALLAGGCSPRMREYKETRPVLYTFVTIHFFYESGIRAEELAKLCWQELDEINDMMNPYAEEGDLALLNQSGQKGRVVDPRLYAVIERSVDLHGRTEGVFNILIFPLLKLWEEAARSGEPPGQAQIEAALELIDIKGITLKPRNHFVSMEENMRIDTGAVVKGYALERVKTILDAGGIDRFMINAGGDLYCRGLRPGKIPWRIGVQDPEHSDRIEGILHVSDKAVATSGNYEKFFKIKGNKYSHIIDPRNGYPASFTASATVIADSPFLADALATALSVLGGQKGIRLLKEQNFPVEAMILQRRDDHLQVIKTSGYDDYLR